jgi:quercetin dioxygenase-like cupin family protein
VNKQIKITCLSAVLLFCSVISSTAVAQDTKEQAISRTHEDAELQWGPCPPIFAKGCEVAVLRGDPTKGSCDVLLRTPANYTLQRHWHSSSERMVLVAGELHVTYEGQKPSVLRPGTYAYGPSKAKHEARCANRGPCVLFIAFDLPIDAVLATDAPN